MKTINHIFICFLFATGLRAQENVVFLHGINSSGGMWTGSYNMIAKLKQSFYMNATNPTRDDQTTFSVQADDVKTSLNPNINNYIAVGHSMGGLAARTY
ncbi:MAG TPA: alpha/beta hydrolase [bacterium]|nr:alpha/beta hydrolase [bacterium]HMY35165.1 alpha/beta hydrolase [bacterium]HMZ05132.1 alpha/beta hydrolase [bacterium]HNB08484.1 alpha/beta hydrolase [bacterium]HNB55859.1 alpha/beta hydrolase [bacterium]